MESSSLLDAILRFATESPFAGGMVFGAVLSGIMAIKMAEHFGLNAYKSIVEHQKSENESLKEEKECLKREVLEKDKRIEALHDELNCLRQEDGERECKR